MGSGCRDRTGGRIGGRTRGVGLEGSDWRVELRGSTGGVRLGGSNWRGRTGGIELEGWD